jgi:predicted O-methyltransferase YrrM
VAERVEVVEGEALAVLPGLEGPFDLVYLDAVKTEYRRYLDLALPRMAIGGLLVADNLLWKGWVAEPPEAGDADADALRAFAGYLMMHPQLQAVVLPLGDGVGLAVKTRPTVMEMGGPF